MGHPEGYITLHSITIVFQVAFDFKQTVIRLGIIAKHLNTVVGSSTAMRQINCDRIPGGRSRAMDNGICRDCITIIRIGHKIRTGSKTRPNLVTNFPKKAILVCKGSCMVESLARIAGFLQSVIVCQTSLIHCTGNRDICILQRRGHALHIRRGCIKVASPQIHLDTGRSILYNLAWRCLSSKRRRAQGHGQRCSNNTGNDLFHFHLDTPFSSSTVVSHAATGNSAY